MGADEIRFETLDLAREGGLATITLNRPEALNALNETIARELRAAIEHLSADEGVRAVVLTGAGRSFSAGADLKEQRPGPDGGPPDLGERLRELYHPVILGIREMPKPVVAAVNGPAVGVGLSMALACDLVLAAESAYFLLAFVNIGLVPDGGSTATVPARVGLARATEMAMLGERVPAELALDWGMINAVHPDGDLAAAANALGARLAAGPTSSYAATKRLLNRRLYADLAEQLEAEAEAQRGQGLTGDFAEGVLAFLQKRDPEFPGR